MGRWLAVFSVALILISSGCIQKNRRTRYVCPDGTYADDPLYCKIPETTIKTVREYVCANGDVVSDPGKCPFTSTTSSTTLPSSVWFYIDPIQCGLNFWERANKTLAEHLAENNITVLKMVSTQQYEVVCLACTCPRGDRIHVLAAKAYSKRLRELGFKVGDAPPQKMPDAGQTTTINESKTTTSTTSSTTTSPGSRAPGVRITAAEFNAPGDDRKKENLNGEWVEVKNKGAGTTKLRGWTLHDEAAKPHTYTFPNDLTLAPGEAVRVHTGSGRDRKPDLYWEATWPVWNNDGDTTTLVDSHGRVVDTYTQ